ncbi:MAG: flagellar basal body rod protein FlgB [Lachnospiraceae bacterium]|nr:flagellar basal body rod protein FlgB [Lachnospiraceae bacterium]
MNLMFGNSISMGTKSLEFLWAKQSVISNNLSNIDTPHYKSKYVTFEEAFKNRLKLARATQDSGQTRSIIDSANYTVLEKSDSSTRLDGNNVNADSEEVEMVRTYLQYQSMLQAINSDFTRLRTVIKGQ